MSDTKIPEPLREMLFNYFDVELFWHSFPELIQDALATDPDKAAQFKAQFAEAITQSTISLGDYYQLTHHQFDDEVELAMWLTKLWKEIYGDEPIPGDD